MDRVAAYLWIGLGSALGGMGRVWFSGWVTQRCGEAFPWGTLLVNVTGSFVIGVLSAFSSPAGRWTLAPRLAQFLMIGVCGGYTTFSSFSLQTLNLMRAGEWFYATSNAVLSVLCCFLFVWLGHWAGQTLQH